MKEKWLEDIQEKMNNFELNEPQGLWDQIQQRQEQQTPKRKLLWIMPVVRAAAACAVVVILSLTYFYQTHDHNTDDSQIVVAQKDSSNSNISLNLAENRPNITTIKTNISDQRKQPSAHLKTDPVNTRYVSETEESDKTITTVGPTTSDNLPVEPKDTYNSDKSEPERQTIPQTDDRMCYTSNSYTERKHNNRFSIGVFSAGIIGNSNNQRPLLNSCALSYKWLDSDNYSEDISTLVRSRAAADDDVSGIEMQHHIPIRFGLTAQYDLTPRFGIESGITYSRLSSDLSTENNRPIKGEQILHYIGMPVNLKYRLASWKALSIYASAGAMLEKCVDGTLTRHTTLPNGTNEKKSLKLKENALQWSSNIAIDLQVNLTRHIGLYVQPGVAYYFNNGSEIRNIYKDRQFNFNINLGLRYSFGKNDR